MKRIAFLLMIAASVIACKKEKKSSEKPLALDIQRHWTTTSERNEMYSESGALIYTETPKTGVKYYIDATQVKITYTNGSVRYAPYTIANVNGKNMITVNYEAGPVTYEIVQIDADTMRWKAERTNVTYTENGVTKTAAKQTTSIDFICPCK